MKNTIFRYGFCMAGLIIFLSGLIACDRTTGERVQSESEGKKEETQAMKLDRKYPGANDWMVYIPLEEPILQQWSLAGKRQKNIRLPITEYGGTDEYSLLWVDNEELIWSVYIEGKDYDGERVLSTPVRQSESGEDVLLDQTKELFTEDSLDIDGIGDLPYESSITYADENRILFFCEGELYEYSRTAKKGLVRLESPEEENDSWYAVSAMMMGQKMIYHSGRTPGRAESNVYEFWCYDLAAKKRESIDDRCYSNAAYVTDTVRDRVYYQIIDDQGIWEYDSVTGEKRELISEKDFKQCCEKNQLSWEDPSCNDGLFVEGDRLYYIKDKETPRLFSYSFTDASLSFEKELTDAVQRSRYKDIYNISDLTVVRDKLVLMLDYSMAVCYLCIDLQTAEITSVGPNTPEIIYFGMLGVWDASEERIQWEEQTGEKENENTAATDRAETVEEQLALISRQKDVWLPAADEELGELIEIYNYAITDLDHNGRLEVIASSGSQGSGGFTSSTYYQVSSDGTRLCEIHDNEGSGAVDIVDEIKTAYVDTKTDTWYYCVNDYTSGGAGARYIWYGAMVLRNGMFTCRTYAGGESTWNKKKTEEVWHYSRYRDGKEEKLKGKEIDTDTLTGDFFKGFEKKKVTISWFTIDSKSGKSEKKIQKLVEKSYKGFQVK